MINLGFLLNLRAWSYFVRSSIAALSFVLPKRYLEPLVKSCSGFFFRHFYPRYHSYLSGEIADLLDIELKTATQIAERSHAVNLLSYLERLGIRDLDAVSSNHLCEKVVIAKGDKSSFSQLEKNTGILILSAHFSPTEFLLFAEVELDNRKVVVVTYLDFNSKTLNKISKLYSSILGDEIELIDAHSSGAAVKMMRELRAGNIVICLYDVFIKGQSFLVSAFFDRYILSLSTVLHIALKTNSDIFPCFVIKQKEQYNVYIEESLPIKGSSQEEKLICLSASFNSILEEYVRQFPAEWEMWSYLSNRWVYFDSEPEKNE